VKRNPLVVDGLTYPIQARRYSSSSVTLEALHPVTGQVVASGSSRGDLVASIRRDPGPATCGKPAAKDTESLDRVIPRSPDQHDQPDTTEARTGNPGYVEPDADGGADEVWSFATGALIALALGVVIGATWDPLAATVTASLSVTAGVAITLWRAR